jgi:hypothetical protein
LNGIEILARASPELDDLHQPDRVNISTVSIGSKTALKFLIDHFDNHDHFRTTPIYPVVRDRDPLALCVHLEMIPL